jgi:hypothetical protein
MEKFHLKKLHEVESKDQYNIEVLNRCAALEDLDTENFFIYPLICNLHQYIQQML